MAHSLIVGLTGSGKTTLAVKLAEGYMVRGKGVIVLDPLLDTRWKSASHYVTDSPGLFMKAVQESRSCAIFLDESGETVGKYNDEMFWLATRSRHAGHNAHFITQRANQLSPTVRDQCEYLFAFSVSKRDAKMLADDFASDELLQLPSLPPGSCIMKSRFSTPKLLTVMGRKPVLPINFAEND